MSQLLATLYPCQFKPAFHVIGVFVHKATPIDILGKKVVKGTAESKAANVERAYQMILEGEDTITGLANEMNVSVASANSYVAALVKDGRVIKGRSRRVNGVHLRPAQ